MDPVQRIWLYNNWIGDQNDNAELAKNHAYLLASFWNPEAVKQIMGDNNVHESTEEEYEESLDIVRNQSLSLIGAPKEEPKVRRRNRKSISVKA